MHVPIFAQDHVRHATANDEGGVVSGIEGIWWEGGREGERELREGGRKEGREGGVSTFVVVGLCLGAEEDPVPVRSGGGSLLVWCGKKKNLISETICPSLLPSLPRSIDHLLCVALPFLCLRSLPHSILLLLTGGSFCTELLQIRSLRDGGREGREVNTSQPR